MMPSLLLMATVTEKAHTAPLMSVKLLRLRLLLVSLINSTISKKISMLLTSESLLDKVTQEGMTGLIR
jgi:hypothetical protein